MSADTEGPFAFVSEERQPVWIAPDTGQCFWREIHDASLGLPYRPVLVQEVYRAFCIWCVRNGEKRPARVNRFAPSFMSLNGVHRCRRFPDAWLLFWLRKGEQTRSIASAFLKQLRRLYAMVRSH